MTKFITMILINLVTPKAAAKLELLLKNGLRKQGPHARREGGSVQMTSLY
jgi:hypothetical protein